MPELPEVETVVRSIAQHLTGHMIRAASVSSQRVTRNNHKSTERSLAGRKIERVGRHGKQILIDLDRGLLYVHLGMTGNLLWNAVPGKHTRALLELDNGVLVMNDMRQFGRFEYYAEKPEQRAGPDALETDFDTFFARLQKRHSAIKPLLLNQSFIGGVGNIYADEALFASRIHPRTIASRLSKTRAQRLYGAIVEVLRSAIEHRGSTISNHVDSCGEKGGYQHLHAVYGREGEPCLRCGTPIRRIVLGQRSSHYCPRCQRV